MFAVIINTIAIILGSIIGLVIKQGIPKRLSESMLQGLGLCTVIIGVQGAIQTSNILVMIVSIAVGLAIGECCRLDDRVNHSTQRLLARVTRGRGSAAKITEAFVTSCLIMNVGAMVIVGSLDAGLVGNYTMLYTKSLLDFISGIMLAATMGAGVLGSALFTLLFQGTIVLFAEFLAPYMSDQLIAEMSVTGCALILAIGLNMLNLTKLKVINYIPALLVVPVSLKLMELCNL
ncbi:MAG: DUF554 domain-containing protein [Succinivibrio sp.]|nr:DUF554 domain-containing protein [Succinivibrio sp.]